MDVLTNKKLQKMQCLRHEVIKMSPFQASVCHINEAAGGNAMTTSRNRKKTSKNTGRSIEFQENPSNFTQLRHVDTFWLFDFCEMWIFIQIQVLYWRSLNVMRDYDSCCLKLASSLGAPTGTRSFWAPADKKNIIYHHIICYAWKVLQKSTLVGGFNPFEKY